MADHGNGIVSRQHEHPSSPVDDQQLPAQRDDDDDEDEDDDDPTLAAASTPSASGAAATETVAVAAAHSQGGEHRELLDLLGPAYARSFRHWKAILYSSVLSGLLMGALSLAFVNYFTAISESTWHSGTYQAALQAGGSLNRNGLGGGNNSSNNGGEGAGDDGGGDASSGSSVEPLLLGNGQAWYIGMLAGGGLAVGIIKCLWTYLIRPFPDKIPGFLKDVQDLRSDDVLLPIPVLLASGISLGLGASVGPEAALASAGAAFGTLIQVRWADVLCCRRDPLPLPSRADESPSEQQEPPLTPTTSSSRFWSTVLPDLRDDPLCTLDAMSAAFAGLFPAQFLSPLLIYELGGHWGPGGRLAVTETLVRSGVASTAAYALYVSVKGKTLLDSFNLPLAAYDVAGSFQLIWVLYGWCMGIVCGLVGLVGFLCLAIGNVLGKAVTKRLNAIGDKCPLPFDGFLGKLLTPAIGGAVVGALAMAAPLILGDGSVQIVSVLTLSDELGVGTLAGTAFIKFVAFGISLGFGFVGGPFFPLIFVGACTGSIVHLLVPDVPLILAYSCCLVGVPSSIMPGFFFMTSVAATFLVLGGPATTVVFFTVVVSYNTVCGMGIVQDLLMKAARRQEEAAAAAAEGKDSGQGDRFASGDGSSNTLNPLLQKAWDARHPTTLSSVRRRRRPSSSPQAAAPSSVEATPAQHRPALPPEADVSQLTSFSV